jgi:hypothetical protein
MTNQALAPKKLATQVQPIETSYLNKIPKSFRQYLTGKNHEELHASAELYRNRDSVTGTHNFDNFIDCRNRAWFSVSIETRKVRVATNSCRLRWCPLCSQALTRYRTHSISEWLESQGTSRFLTLTLKHSDLELSEQIDLLYYYFGRLRKIKYFNQVVTGGIWFFQIKRSKRTGEWHPHLHCLVTGSYIIHPRLSKIWEQITQGSTVVDIRTIREEKSVVDYVSRYSSRPALLAEYSGPDRSEIFDAMHGRRLCGKWGTGRSCSLSPSKTIDLSEWRKVGTWRSIVTRAPFIKYCKLVFKCWKQDIALPEYINLTWFDRPEHLFDDADLQSAIMLHVHEVSYP